MLGEVWVWVWFFFAVKCVRQYRSDKVDDILVPRSRSAAGLFDRAVGSAAVAELTPGRMSPHLGAMGAGESGVIPMTCR